MNTRTKQSPAQIISSIAKDSAGYNGENIVEHWARAADHAKPRCRVALTQPWGNEAHAVGPH